MMKNSQARQHIFVVAERTHFGSFGVEMNLWCLLFMMSGEINNKFVIADRWLLSAAACLHNTTTTTTLHYLGACTHTKTTAALLAHPAAWGAFL